MRQTLSIRKFQSNLTLQGRKVRLFKVSNDNGYLSPTPFQVVLDAATVISETASLDAAQASFERVCAELLTTLNYAEIEGVK